MNQNIPYPVITIIIPGLLAVLGSVSIFLGIITLIGFGLYKAGKFSKDTLDAMDKTLMEIISTSFPAAFAPSAKLSASLSELLFALKLFQL